MSMGIFVGYVLALRRTAIESRARVGAIFALAFVVHIAESEKLR